ncbi:MAG: TIGR04282 family arsenosugar biosynthesis glycosyltransferase [Candidatus Acidiferrales bacterium]
MENSRQIRDQSLNGLGTLVIMAKAPRPGMVKTRLARSIPAPAVTELYRCLLDDTLALARSLDGIEVAIMCPVADVEEMVRATGDRVRVVPQIGNGLEAGLNSVFAHFAEAGRRRVVAFNSDTPHLPASILADAFRALPGSDLAVGPTHDGGYYLVGATTFHPELFTGDVMGTANAFESLLARAHTLGLTVHLTDPCYDIDEMADLRRVAAELQSSPGKAPRTAAWLLAWGKASPHTRLPA